MVETKRDCIIKRAVLELRDGAYVTLGIGLPTLIAQRVSPSLRVFFLSENGLLGLGPPPPDEDPDPDLINAGKEPATAVAGACFVSSDEAFVMIRGGHIDLAILGAMEVDEKGNLANWMVPGKMVKGMGGAMDLVVGARRVVVVMEHTTREGAPKILRHCILPLTGLAVVERIITDMAVVDVTPAGLILREIAPRLTVEEVRQNTEADLMVDKDLRIMEVCAELL
jgi:3-oxoacid CoA-transferase subunit B